MTHAWDLRWLTLKLGSIAGFSLNNTWVRDGMPIVNVNKKAGQLGVVGSIEAALWNGFHWHSGVGGSTYFVVDDGDPRALFSGRVSMGLGVHF